MRTGPYRRGRNEAPRVAKAFPIGTTGDSASATASHVRSAALNSSIRLASPTSASDGDDRVGDQPDQDHHPDRPQRHPPQLGELGRLDPGRVGAGLPQVVEVPVLVADGVAGLAFDRRRLQQRQHLGEGVGPQRGQRGRRGAFQPHRQRGRHQHLGAVGGDVGVVGGHPGAPEVPEGRGPVGPDQDPGGVQPSMGHPQGMQPPKVAPDAGQELVVELAGIQPVQWAAGGLGHQQRVLLRRHPGGHDREHRHLGPLGQQRDERLVLDLLRGGPTPDGACRPGTRARSRRRPAAGRPRRPGRTPSPAASARPAPRRWRWPPRGAPAAPGAARWPPPPGRPGHRRPGRG